MWQIVRYARLAAFLWKLPAMLGGIAGAMVAAWQYLERAPLLVAGAFGGATAALVGITVLLVLLWLNRPAPGSFTPWKLRFYDLPIRRVRWNFDNYLAGDSRDGVPFVTCFMISFRVRGQGIVPHACYIQSDRTGEYADVLIERGNPYMKADGTTVYPPGKRYYCQTFFGDQGMTKEQFLRRFDGFTFVCKYGDTAFSRHFPRWEIETLLDTWWQQSNQSQEPKPWPKVG